MPMRYSSNGSTPARRPPLAYVSTSGHRYVWNGRNWRRESAGPRIIRRALSALAGALYGVTVAVGTMLASVGLLWAVAALLSHLL